MKKFVMGTIILIVLLTTFVVYNIESNPNFFKSSTKENRPNIILILTDDVSVSMIDFLLQNNMMPNLQEHIITNGTTFTNSFVSSPLCCPSRVTFLTGLYPHNHEILFNKPILFNDTLVVKGGFEDFNDSSTVATWLKNAGGYSTAFIGKYMNGYYGQITYVPPGWDEWKAFAGATEVMYNFGINDNGRMGRIVGEYKTDYIANSSVDFINNSELPFFLFVSTLVAHSTQDAPECDIGKGDIRKSVLVSPKYSDTLENLQITYKPSFNEKDISDKNPIIRETPLIENTDCLELQFKDRASSLRSVDDLIGLIHTALVDNEQLENTVIIFTSDNGYSFGEHRIFDKVVPYEESIRVPLYIKGPGFEKQSIEYLVINNDLVPTILDLADFESEISMDGISLLSIMNKTSNIFREDFLIELYTGNGNFYHAIRGNNYLYVEWSGTFNFTEYYDLNNDPYQQSNLVDCIEEKCIKKLKNLKSRLKELKECGYGTC